MARKVRKSAQSAKNSDAEVLVTDATGWTHEKPSPEVAPEKSKVRKCGRQVEVTIKVPGYVPKASAVVDIDKLDAAERAVLLDQLLDSLIEQMK